MYDALWVTTAARTITINKLFPVRCDSVWAVGVTMAAGRRLSDQEEDMWRRINRLEEEQAAEAEERAAARQRRLGDL